MRGRIFWWSIVLLSLVAASLLAFIPGTFVFAQATHHATSLADPAPTPDAGTVLQMAQQQETHVQTILNMLNFLVVAFPLMVTVAVVVLAFFGRSEWQLLKKQAQEALEEATKKKDMIAKTQEALVYMALGDRLSNQNDTRMAMAVYKKVGDLLPDDPQINYVLGRIYSGFGYYEEAINSFEAALAVKPDYPETEMELGLAYRRRGEYRQGTDAQVQREQDYEKAIKHLQHAVTLRPRYDDALSTLGGLYRRMSKYEKALEYYEDSYRACPSAYALGNVASLAWYLGDLDKARKYYMLTELTAMDRTVPNHAEIYWDYYDLALAQLALGKTEEAKRNYVKAIGETPGVVQFDSVLSVLCFLKGAKNPMPHIDEVIQMIEKEKAATVSLT